MFSLARSPKLGFSRFMAFDGKRDVATGVLYTQEDSAWMGWAGTLPK